MLNFHKDHKNLLLTATFSFLMLSILIAVVPAYEMEKYEPLPGQQPLTHPERLGLRVYISEGCVACHTQQVRNIEMDNVWGERPSIASDYYYSKKRMDIWRQSPSLLGSERTGPDLTNVGVRQPNDNWHMYHLYNPRSVVKESIMPGYPWLFEEKDTADVTQDDIVLPASVTHSKKGKVTVAKEQAKHLVAYLKSLKQVPLMPEASETFIPSIKEKVANTADIAENSLDGKKLYQSTCAACHQINGQGVKGAFPSLVGSTVVNDDNPELLIKIIMQGYDARPNYGQMPGFGELLTDEEITAIINHERTSWGNSARKVSVDEVKKIRDIITLNN